MFKLLTKLILGTSLLAAFFPPGVPSNPPFPVAGTKVAGYAPIVQSDLTVAWASPGGGSGLTVTGTPAAGDTVIRNTFDGTWEPARPGAGVYRIKDFGASGRGDISTTGTVSASSKALTLASASTFLNGQGLAIVGAGATHGLSVPGAPVIGVGGTAGATTYAWAIAAGAADGGYTQVGTATSATNGNATLDATNYCYVCWDAVANAKYYLISGRSSTQANRGIINRVPSAKNAKVVTFQAGGYTNAVQSDIGKAVVGPSGSDGVLAGYDNTNRKWWVIPTVFGSDPFTSFGSVTITTGTGAGTSTAVADGYAWKDTGDASSLAGTVSQGAQSGQTNQPSFARRASSEYYPGDIVKHPNDPTGVYYLCVRIEIGGNSGVYPRSSSTTTASWSPTSTIGATTRDGDITWMAVQLPIPSDEPTAAVPNLLRTTIDDISGTSVTLTDPATNSVTSQIVLHDDYSAIDATYNAAAAANAPSATIYFDPGYYIAILGDSTANTWSQWENVNFQPRVWPLGSVSWKLSEFANFWVMPLTFASNADGSGLNENLFRSTDSIDWSYSGGNTVLVNGAEPKFLQADGWNKWEFYSDDSTDSGVSQRVNRSKITNAGLWGFPSLLSGSASVGIGQGIAFTDNRVNWGYAGHNALAVGDIGQFSRNTCFGHPAFGSDLLYTQDGATDIINDMVQIRDNKIRRSRYNGMRLRVSHCTVSGNDWLDSQGDIILCDDTFEGVIASNYAKNGGQFNLTGVVTFAGNQLYNSRLNVAGGDVSVSGGVSTFDTSADTYFSGGNVQVAIAGGTRCTISGMSIKNTETSVAATTLGITGGTDIILDGLFIDAASDYAFYVTSGFTGTLVVNGGTIDTNGATGISLAPGNGANITIAGATIRSGGGGAVTASNGNLWFKNNTCFINTDFTSGLDYLECVGNAINKAASGATGLDVPNAIYQNNTFGSAPAASTQTGVHARGNSIAGAEYVSPTELSSGTTNDYGISQVASVIRLNPNASNSTITSIVPRGAGDVITIYCAADAAETLTIDDAAATGTAAYRILLKGAADGTLSNKEYLTIMYDGVQTRWVEIGGSY